MLMTSIFDKIISLRQSCVFWRLRRKWRFNRLLCEWSMHTEDPQARREIAHPACHQCCYKSHLFHGYLDGRKYIGTFGFQNPSDDELGSYGWGGLQLVFRFTCEPKGPLDTLLVGSAKMVWWWINFVMRLLSKGPIHASVGCHPIIYC